MPDAPSAPRADGATVVSAVTPPASKREGLTGGHRGPSQTTRVLRVIGFGLLGALAEFIGTAIHRSAVTIGDASLPWGVFGALIAIALIAFGLRFGYGMLPALVFGLGVVAVVAFMLVSSSQPGSSVLLPVVEHGYVPAWVAYAWTWGSVILSVLAVIVPDLRPRREAAA